MKKGIKSENNPKEAASTAACFNCKITCENCYYRGLVAKFRSSCSEVIYQGFLMNIYDEMDKNLDEYLNNCKCNGIFVLDPQINCPCGWDSCWQN